MRHIAFCLLILAGNVFAEGFMVNAKIAELRVDRDGKGLATFDRMLTNTPAGCGVSFPKSLSFDTNTSGGKAVFALLASAQIAGKSVTAAGTGTCAEYGGVESWSYGSQLTL